MYNVVSSDKVEAQVFRTTKMENYNSFYGGNSKAAIRKEILKSLGWPGWSNVMSLLSLAVWSLHVARINSYLESWIANTCNKNISVWST